MDIHRIRRVIEGARARDGGRFAGEIAARLPKEAPEALARQTELLRHYIETAPDMLDTAHKWTRLNGLETHYRPMFDQIEAYFINPDDEIEDERYGLFGVLDDAYLALKTVELIQQGGMPLLVEARLGEMNGLARRVLGDEIGGRLDERVDTATAELLTRLLGVAETILQAPPAVPVRRAESFHDPALVGVWVQQGENGAAITRQFESDGTFTDQDKGAGHWEADGKMITLFWNNHTFTDYFYESRGDTLLLKQPGHPLSQWSRAAVQGESAS
ncbi:MAG: hypothetical protein SF162_19425 [bacterium]|nr:hypothetical protein [bacterium]